MPAGWEPRPALHVPRGGLIDAMTDGGTTYAIGGFTSGFGAELDAVEALDRTGDRWRSVAPMPTARGNPAAAAVRGDVYVLGGFVGDTAVATVEIFDRRWRTGRPLPAARGGACAAEVDGRIYVVGGFGADDKATGAVDVYDPRADTWQARRPMPSQRGLLKAAEVDGRLYAIGGVDDAREFLATVERYDPRTDTWEAVAPLLTPRGNPGVAVDDRRIFAVGGGNPAGPLRTTERYDPRADRWQPLEPLLAVGRVSLSAACRTRGGTELLAFGGFEITGGAPIASARVEAFPLRQP